MRLKDKKYPNANLYYISCCKMHNSSSSNSEQSAENSYERLRHDVETQLSDWDRYANEYFDRYGRLPGEGERLLPLGSSLQNLETIIKESHENATRLEEELRTQRDGLEELTEEIEQRNITLDLAIRAYRNALDRFSSYIQLPGWLLSILGPAGPLFVSGMRFFFCFVIGGVTIYGSYRLIRYFVGERTDVLQPRLATEVVAKTPLYLKTVTKPTVVGLLNRVWDSVSTWLFKK